MESFIDNPNLFCIQFIDGYIIQTTPADSESCADPDQFGNYCICRSRGDNSAKIGCCFTCENHSEYSDIQYKLKLNTESM